MAAEAFRIEIPINIEDKTDPGISQATRKVNGFDRAAQKTQERLNQMNRAKYQVVLDALDRASGVIGSVSSRARSIAGKTFSFTMEQQHSPVFHSNNSRLFRELVEHSKRIFHRSTPDIRVQCLGKH